MDHEDEPVTIENFKNYIEFRILDSIAYPGTYKKFMAARKEQGIEWAIDMSKHVQAVQAAFADIEQKEQQLRSSSQLSQLHIVWMHVAESNLPPSDLQLTIATCMISKKSGVPCVIIKGKGRGAQPFTVHSRFCTFLHDIWIVYKIDVLIKAFARSCIDEVDPTGKMPMAEIVETFKVSSSLLRTLSAICDVFLHRRKKRRRSSFSPMRFTLHICTSIAPPHADCRPYYSFEVNCIY
jgi:hypothetical protein